LALQAFTPDSPNVTPDSLVASLHQCYVELAVGLLFLGAPNSPACGTRQSGVPPDSLVLSAGQSASGNTFFVSWTSFDLHNVFF
jgi:hypothetical protein